MKYRKGQAVRLQDKKCILCDSSHTSSLIEVFAENAKN